MEGSQSEAGNCEREGLFSSLLRHPESLGARDSSVQIGDVRVVLRLFVSLLEPTHKPLQGQLDPASYRLSGGSVSVLGEWQSLVHFLHGPNRKLSLHSTHRDGAAENVGVPLSSQRTQQLLRNFSFFRLQFWLI